MAIARLERRQIGREVPLALAGAGGRVLDRRRRCAEQFLEAGIGAVLGGLKCAAVAVAGVNASIAPVQAAAVVPFTVGELAATVTL